MMAKVMLLLIRPVKSDGNVDERKDTDSELQAGNESDLKVKTKSDFKVNAESLKKRPKEDLKVKTKSDFKVNAESLKKRPKEDMAEKTKKRKRITGQDADVKRKIDEQKIDKTDKKKTKIDSKPKKITKKDEKQIKIDTKPKNTTLQEYLNFKHVCVCGDRFKLRCTLTSHVRRKHPGYEMPPTNRVIQLPKCPLCEEHIEKIYLKSHLQTKHDVELPREKLTFNSYAEFETWKREIEKSTMSFYKKDGGSKARKKGIYHRFECHRSGCHISKSRGQRTIKFQGSNRMNRFCPAVIRVLESRGGSCAVEFVNKHLGHTHDLAHLPLSAEDREALARKVDSKVSFHEILNEVRNSLPTDVQRIHFLEWQDLKNIKNKVKERQKKECKNPGIPERPKKIYNKNLDAWISENSACILHYKAQEEEHTVLSSEDFFLVLMNNTQQEMLKKYGSDCVCIDTIEGVTGNGFELVTLCILDEMGQGFPAAFLFSNRIDEDTLCLFFFYLKDKVGSIKPKIFMSDFPDCYFNAWLKEMQLPEKRYFCTWLINDEWHKNLSKIKCRTKRVLVHSLLRYLLEERDMKSFEKMLNETVEQLYSDEATVEYGNYFYRFYVQSAIGWAYCHRLDSEINMDMYLERVHKTLKYICHSESPNTSTGLERPIDEVMKFVRFTVLDRLLTLNPEKVTKRVKILNDRHKRVAKMNKLVRKNYDGGYTVFSRDSNRQYRVRDNINNCPCQIICPGCKVCLHRYVCVCIESTVKWNMCIHIHLVANFVKNGFTNSSVRDIPQNEYNAIDDASDCVDSEFDASIPQTESTVSDDASDCADSEFDAAISQTESTVSDDTSNCVDSEFDAAISQTESTVSDDTFNCFDNDFDASSQNTVEDSELISLSNYNPIIEQKREHLKRKFSELIDTATSNEQFEFLEETYKSLTNTS